MRLALAFVAALLTFWFPSAQACGPQVLVTYVEDSPDAFRIEFVNGPQFELQQLRLDLSSSQGRAHIDTPYGAAPSREPDSVELVRVDDIAERGQFATLTFRRFFAGRTFRYLIDLDDESPAGDGDFDHLTAGELAGAQASAQLRHADGRIEKISGRFSRENVARLAPRACV